MSGRSDGRISNRVAVLTISDRCSREENEDKSGPYIANYLNDKGYQIVHKFCIPDDFQLIQEVLIDWCNSSKVDLILTTGGTGFTDRDITPEATKSIIEREAPGLVIGMIVGGLKSTEYAMLSRLAAGICKSTLIVNLPGSVKACKEYLPILEPVVNHGIDQLRGDRLRVKVKHTEMQEPSKPIVLTIKDPNESAIQLPSGQPGTSSPAVTVIITPTTTTTTTSSVSSSSIKTPSTPTSVPRLGFQYRRSPYELITIKEAISRIMSECSSTAKFESEWVPLKNTNDLIERRVSIDIQSKVDIPPFPASIKDGYAVCTADGLGPRKVIPSSITAGLPPDGIAIDRGWCARINTGAPVPDGADAVIQVEDTEVLDRSDDGQEKEIYIKSIPKLGLDIRKKGSDIKKGETVIKEGSKIGPIELGLLASIGISLVPVYRRPKVALLSTGDELREPGDTLVNGAIWDCNRITLISFLRRLNFEVIDLGIVEDESRFLESRICSGLERADILLTTGGVSMGEKDMLKTVLTNSFGAKIHFGRINMKPGKPTTFATCTTNQRRRFIFALPGNPVSAFVTCYLFVLPVLNYLSGESSSNENAIDDLFDLHPWLRVRLQTEKLILLDDRPEFARAIVHFDGDIPTAFLVRGHQRSSRLASVKDANALVLLPTRSEIPSGAIKDNFITKAILINF